MMEAVGEDALREKINRIVPAKLGIIEDNIEFLPCLNERLLLWSIPPCIEGKKDMGFRCSFVMDGEVVILKLSSEEWSEFLYGFKLNKD